MFVDFLRDYWRTYKFEFIISCLLLVLFCYYNSLVGCSYPLDNETEVYGSCRSLNAFENKRLTLNYFSVDKSRYDNMALASVDNNMTMKCAETKLKCVCEPCTTVTTTTSTTNIPVTTSTIKFSCDCPKLDSVDYQDIKNARPDLGSSAYQQGYFNMKKRCLVAVGLPTSRFNEGPGIFTQANKLYLDRGQSVVFALVKGEFTVNKSWDVLDDVNVWRVVPHVPVLNNTWENGSYKPSL